MAALDVMSLRKSLGSTPKVVQVAVPGMSNHSNPLKSTKDLKVATTWIVFPGAYGSYGFWGLVWVVFILVLHVTP